MKVALLALGFALGIVAGSVATWWLLTQGFDQTFFVHSVSSHYPHTGRHDTERIRDHRFNFALQALVWWIIPVLMVYALGWATAWVVRGFQNKGRV
jgi:hypothetical protein